jgi:hypothetical protein
MKKFLLSLSILLSSLAYGDEITGLISKVNMKKNEIYVMAEKNKYEFYFSNETTLKKAGQDFKFSDLKKDQKVKVMFTKDEKGKTVPSAVEVL